MMTIEEVMQLTRTVSSATAFDDGECQAMYDALQTIPFGGVVVEIGCQLGRSSSIIAQCALGRFHSIHVDPFTDQPDFLKAWHEMMWSIGGRDHFYTHLCMRTEQARWQLEMLGNDGIDLAFIDGDHEYPGVMIDLEILCPLIKAGGLLTMHDYGRDSLPGVYKAASEYINGAWEQVGVYGTLGIWSKR